MSGFVFGVGLLTVDFCGDKPNHPMGGYAATVASASDTLAQTICTRRRYHRRGRTIGEARKGRWGSSGDGCRWD